MKKLYMVAVGPTIDRDVAIGRLEQLSGYGPWFYSMPNMFCIYSRGTAIDIFNVLHNPNDVNEQLFVTEVPANSAGWLPKQHCDLMAQNSVVHSYSLNFRGYWVDGRQVELPASPGIYCVYACGVMSDLRLSVSRLLYIGKAENLKARHMNHERHEDWKRWIGPGETLCFSCAELPIQSLSVCEAALIYKHQPCCNDQLRDSFHHSTTQVVTSGANVHLSTNFTLCRSA